jgi:DNA modification methylase
MENIAVNLTLHLGDCIEYMSQMESNSIDLTVTSPPYDDIRNYEDTLAWDWDTFKCVAADLYNITKEGGVVVWIVGDATINGNETGSSFKQALYFKEIGFNLHDTMIYRKENPPPTGGNNRYYSSFEYMFVFSKGTPKTFNPILVQRRNKWNDKRTTRNKSFVRDKDGNFESKQVDLNLNEPVKMQNVWTITVGGGISAEEKIAFEHPAIFPEKVAENHILSWSNEGDIIFDPFTGSGTTGKMALKNNRSFIGTEIVPEYFKIAEKRLARFHKMHDLLSM